MNRLIVWLALACLLAAAAESVARADDGCCALCGCCCPCQPTCRLVMEEKRVEVVCWGVKCEDFCVPCRNERGGKNCDILCESCGDKAAAGISVAPKKFVWYDWLPGSGAQIYTKHKLMRGVTTKKVPSFKWVVDDLCPDCTAKYQAQPLEPGVEIPPPPLVAENVLVLGPASR